MQTPQFVSQLAENDGVRSTVEAVATHPKVTAAVIVGNGSVITAINTEIITGYLALFSSVMTAVVSMLIASYWIIKNIREWSGLRKGSKE